MMSMPHRHGLTDMEWFSLYLEVSVAMVANALATAPWRTFPLIARDATGLEILEEIEKVDRKRIINYSWGEAIG